MSVSTADERGLKLIETGGDANPPSRSTWIELIDSRSWDVIIDVGANYGEMLIDADLSRHGLVIAIEPNPDVCHHLLHTVSRNQLPVQVVCAALGAANTLMELDISDSSSGVAFVRPVDVHRGDKTARLLTPVLRLDDLIDTMGIALDSSAILMKIDVEGHEPEVLRGADRVLTSAQKITVMSEVLHNPFVPDGFEVTHEVFSSWEPDRLQDVVFSRSSP